MGETVPVILSHMNSGIISSGGGFGSDAVCAVVLTVIIVEFMGTDAAATRHKMSAALFQFDVSETHQMSGIEAFSGQDSRHGIGMSFPIRQGRMQV